MACGWIKDRWGLAWQITPTRLIELLHGEDKECSRRAMLAMMSMIKLDIAAIEQAAQ